MMISDFDFLSYYIDFRLGSLVADLWGVWAHDGQTEPLSHNAIENMLLYNVMMLTVDSRWQWNHSSLKEETFPIAILETNIILNK